MSEKINDKTIFSLFEVTRSIQKTIAARYNRAYWIKAEMNKINCYRHSGHCYPDLVEKKNGKIISQIRSTLWKGDYIKINNKFQKTLNEPLKDGIKILFMATIHFDPLYGLSLHIIDIDPNFTLGDLEREKQENIKRLKKENIYDKNKELSLPMLPQRIAIISVDTSKGYADFLEVFESAKKDWGYHFFWHLFPSLLQGDNAVGKLIQSLNKIKKVIHHFDIVAIVRGGGGDLGLSCYNHYELAKAIALFPIPVLTGIGHSTNETIAELVAFENAITPTKLAEFLIQKFHNFSVPVQEAQKKIIDKSKKFIQEEKRTFTSDIKLLRSATQNILIQNKEHLTSTGDNIKKDASQFCKSQKQNILQIIINLKKDITNHIKKNSLFINHIEQNISNLNPKNVMKRGYSITLYKGKALHSSNQVKKGELLNTILYQGNISSTINSVKKKSNDE